MPLQGDATSAEAEDTFSTPLQSASTADGNGTVADVAGLIGPQILEILNSTAGTATITIEGSFDGTNWYAVGYYQKDNILTPARAVAGIAVTASPFAHVYSLLDQYSRIRARQSASSAGPAPTITATLRAWPT